MVYFANLICIRDWFFTRKRVELWLARHVFVMGVESRLCIFYHRKRMRRIHMLSAFISDSTLVSLVFYFASFDVACVERRKSHRCGRLEENLNMLFHSNAKMKCSGRGDGCYVRRCVANLQAISVNVTENVGGCQRNVCATKTLKRIHIT